MKILEASTAYDALFGDAARIDQVLRVEGVLADDPAVYVKLANSLLV